MNKKKGGPPCAPHQFTALVGGGWHSSKIRQHQKLMREAVGTGIHLLTHPHTPTHPHAQTLPDHLFLLMLFQQPLHFFWECLALQQPQQLPKLSPQIRLKHKRWQVVTNHWHHCHRESTHRNPPHFTQMRPPLAACLPLWSEFEI